MEKMQHGLNQLPTQQPQSEVSKAEKRSESFVKTEFNPIKVFKSIQASAQNIPKANQMQDNSINTLKTASEEQKQMSLRALMKIAMGYTNNPHKLEDFLKGI